MATLIALPASGKPFVKPTRSMTHPLREPKAQGKKRRVKPGEPFDPEDLSRRLNAHLVEQKTRADVRRKAREAKAAADARLYRHVPTVAAAAFERTTTPEVMRRVSRVAIPAGKTHLEGSTVQEPRSSHVTNPKDTQAKTKESSKRQLLTNTSQSASKSQSHWKQALEDANKANTERELFKTSPRTFTTEFDYLKGITTRAALRPMSTGNMLWEEDPIISSPKATAPPLPLGPNDRTNWAQRDEETKKEKPTPLLRKKDSNWILLGMKSMKPDREIENVDVLPPDPITLTKTKGGFLSRFKRHPS